MKASRRPAVRTAAKRTVDAQTDASGRGRVGGWRGGSGHWSITAATPVPERERAGGGGVLGASAAASLSPAASLEAEVMVDPQAGRDAHRMGRVTCRRFAGVTAGRRSTWAAAGRRSRRCLGGKGHHGDDRNWATDAPRDDERLGQAADAAQFAVDPGLTHATVERWWPKFADPANAAKALPAGYWAPRLRDGAGLCGRGEVVFYVTCTTRRRPYVLEHEVGEVPHGGRGRVPATASARLSPVVPARRPGARRSPGTQSAP